MSYFLQLPRNKQLLILFCPFLKRSCFLTGVFLDTRQLLSADWIATNQTACRVYSPRLLDHVFRERSRPTTLFCKFLVCFLSFHRFNGRTLAQYLCECLDAVCLGNQLWPVQIHGSIFVQRSFHKNRATSSPNVL